MSSKFKEDFVFTRGDDWVIIFEMTTDEVTPMDVSGRTYAMQMRTSADATTATATFTCVVGGTSNNEVTCSLTDTLTAAIRPGSYVWDLQETSSGVVSTLGYGSIKVVADVTR